MGLNSVLGMIVGAVLALVSSAAKAEWRKPTALDLSIHLVATAALVVDMSTTTDIKNRPGNWETNPILGRRPGDAKIVAYFASYMALHTAIWYLVPGKWRWVVDGVVLYTEVPCIVHNYNLGFALKVPFM